MENQKVSIKDAFGAIHEGNIAILKNILATLKTEGKLKINAKDEDERTLLHWACSYGHGKLWHGVEMANFQC